MRNAEKISSKHATTPPCGSANALVAQASQSEAAKAWSAQRPACNEPVLDEIFLPLLFAVSAVATQVAVLLFQTER